MLKAKRQENPIKVSRFVVDAVFKEIKFKNVPAERFEVLVRNMLFDPDENACSETKSRTTLFEGWTYSLEVSHVYLLAVALSERKGWLPLTEGLVDAKLSENEFADITKRIFDGAEYKEGTLLIRRDFSGKRQEAWDAITFSRDFWGGEFTFQHKYGKHFQRYGKAASVYNQKKTLLEALTETEGRDAKKRRM